MGRSCSITLLIALLPLLDLSSHKARFGIISVLGCQKSEREALLKFKHTLNDPANQLSSWIGDNCCAWNGVSCDNVTGHVFSLDLRNGFFYYLDAANYYPYSFAYWIGADRYSTWKGQVMHSSLTTNASNELRARKLDPSLAELRQLRYLDLSGNNFQDAPIPDFIGSTKHLRYLNLSRASFSGVVPTNLGNLTRLMALDLYSLGGLTVDDLHWVSGLLNLQSLGMGWINLTNVQDSIQALSRLPSLSDLRLQGCSLGNTRYLSHAFLNSTWLSTLQHLDLSVNNFQGPLPHYFSNLSSLRFLELSGNFFNGSIPLWLRNMRVLESINLNENYFSHVEGGMIMGIMGNPCKFKSLHLSENNLQGEIAGHHDNFSKCITYALESLDLSWNIMLTGTLTYWLGHLTNLKYLDLSLTNFQGPIPISIGNLSSLEVLDLSNNYVNGSVPSSLGNLTSLKILDLSGTSLEGVLSDMHLAHLSNLERLDLGLTLLELNFSSDWIPPFQLSELLLRSCKVEGQLPRWIQMQNELIALDLSNNLLSGKILESIGQCKKLLYLDLSSNLMEGVVSDYHLANLSSAQILDLSFNVLNLNFSYDWVPQFQLREFSMRSCRIQGELPQWIQAQYKLQKLDLSDNDISGKMPNWSWNVNLQELNLSHNHITGPITNFPSQLSFIDLSHNSLSGLITQFPSQLTVIDLSHNSLSGIIPNDCMGNSSDSLYAINLSFNNLSGFVPMSIGLLSNLQFLNLNHNSFEGKIPPTLKRCKMLQILDLGENKLSGNIPSFWAQNHPSLQILRLRANQLYGSIPRKLCSLPQLQMLDLAENNLTGSIPHCFGHLYAMESSPSAASMNHDTGTVSFPSWENVMEVLNGLKLQYTTTLKYVVNLDLSCNSLVGSIPVELTNLSGLIGLNLSYNHLTGRIPEKIGVMTSLESLDLSNNNLSGTIPSSISMLFYLNHLNLSHNELHGEIPTGRQLQTLPDPSIYTDNLGLCGDPLPNKCTRDQGQQWEQEQEQEQEQEGEDSRETTLFYLVVALGFGTGFWGVVGTLLLKRQWRYALFHLVEDIMDYFYVRTAVMINKMRE